MKAPITTPDSVDDAPDESIEDQKFALEIGEIEKGLYAIAQSGHDDSSALLNALES